MKLYYSPGACSLATHITLREAGFPAEFEKVDLKAQRTENGMDFTALNPAGCVPLLILDDGGPVTENVAILSLLAERAQQLGAEGPMARTKLIEMLSFLSTELHIAFKPYFHDSSEADRAAAKLAVQKRMNIIANRMRGPYLFGDRLSVADAYLFVMLRWARNHDIEPPAALADLFDRISAREAVQQSIVEEEPAVPLVAA
ncbi:MAG TPA: glutathione binding-like protein [Sphingomicrobium sp.]|nr:glutathione binding-like protein [Sphingomicrobium sp.]